LLLTPSLGWMLEMKVLGDS